MKSHTVFSVLSMYVVPYEGGCNPHVDVFASREAALAHVASKWPNAEDAEGEPNKYIESTAYGDHTEITIREHTI